MEAKDDAEAEKKAEVDEERPIELLGMRFWDLLELNRGEFGRGIFGFFSLHH